MAVVLPGHALQSKLKMAEFKSKKFLYKNSVKWQSEMKGVLSSFDKPCIEVATPPEFRGHAGIWSPEDFFVASVNCCIMTTFLYYAKREQIELLSYESEAKGTLERVESKFMFSEVEVRPKICIKTKEQVEKIKEIVLLSEKNCLISSSIASKVTVYPEVSLGL